MKYSYLLFVLCIATFMACGDDDDGRNLEELPPVPSCGKAVTVNEAKFNAAQTEPYQITDVKIEGDCLTIDISASGCSVDNWVVNGYASESYAEPIPIIRYVKFDFEVIEACLAFFQTSYEYDLTNWQVEGENVMNINIEGWEPLVRYEY